MIISNNVNQPICPNFKGALQVEGLRGFDSKKLEQVVQIFEAKTKGLPDATLKGECRIIDGSKPYHYTTFETNGKEFASMLTTKFRKIFELKSAENIANILVKFARASKKENKAESVQKEIIRLQKERTNLLRQAEEHKNKKGREELVKAYEARAVRYDKKLNRLEKKSARMHIPQKPLIGAKNWIY